MTVGFEWPGPGGRPCGVLAEERTTGETFICMLRRGHTSREHHWQEVRDGELRSASWIGDGPLTYIGGREQP